MLRATKEGRTTVAGEYGPLQTRPVQIRPNTNSAYTNSACYLSHIILQGIQIRPISQTLPKLISFKIFLSLFSSKVCCLSYPINLLCIHECIVLLLQIVCPDLFEKMKYIDGEFSFGPLPFF